MPTYDYHCENCQKDFTAIHKISDPSPNCPVCGGTVRKKLSAPAVHGAGSKPAAPATAQHGCGAGSCGCRH